MPVRATRFGPRDGVTLFIVTAMLAALTVVGASIFTMSVMDLGISGNYKKGQDALFHAEAGIHYVLSKIQSDVDSGVLVWMRRLRP